MRPYGNDSSLTEVLFIFNWTSLISTMQIQKFQNHLLSTKHQNGLTTKLNKGICRKGWFRNYRNISNISAQILNGSRLVLQLSLTNLLKPGVKLIMKG